MKSHVKHAGSIPGLGRSPGEGHGNPLQYACRRIPWTEESGRLQSIGLHRVRRDGSNLACMNTWNHIARVLWIWLLLFHCKTMRFIHAVALAVVCYFHCTVIFHCMNILWFICPFSYWWISTFLSLELLFHYIYWILFFNYNFLKISRHSI